jgi:hypothetical protein
MKFNKIKLNFKKTNKIIFKIIKFSKINLKFKKTIKII